MGTTLFTGDVNLMDIVDPDVPFRRIGELLATADAVFSNLECCLYTPEGAHGVHHEGFYADPTVAIEALRRGRIAVVGIANNVNYGAAAILNSVRVLDEAGIPHSGAGADLEAARRPAVIERGGRRYGFFQRSSIYWPTNHAAEHRAPGIAVLPGHTAYELPMYRFDTRVPAANRPGIPPKVLTWADKPHLDEFTDEIRALRSEVDVLIVSCHWGLRGDVLDYMREIAAAVIDAGADVVMGHGPHQPLAVGFRSGKPVLYGLGSFTFTTGHRRREGGEWIGLLAEIDWDAPGPEVRLRFVRRNAENETVLRHPDEEPDELRSLTKRSAIEGAQLVQCEDLVVARPLDRPDSPNARTS